MQFFGIIVFKYIMHARERCMTTLKEGDIGGFWIPQNRKKKIDKYRIIAKKFAKYRNTARRPKPCQNEIVALHNLKITGKY